MLSDKSLPETVEQLHALCRELQTDLATKEKALSETEKKVTEKRIWPGYLLVRMKMTDESWHFVKDTNGVIDFLGGQKPSPLTQIEVDEILRELEEKKEEITHKHKLNPGDKVKITEGVFVNFIGTILEVNHDKGRVSVMVSIFGRDTRVDDLEFTQIEEIIGE